LRGVKLFVILGAMRSGRDSYNLVIPLFILLLCFFGLVIIYSVSNELFVSQLQFLFLGVLLFVIFSFIDYKILTGFGWFGYLFMILVLVLLLVIGGATRGSTRWFDLGFFKLQPSEVFKPFFIVFFAFFVTSATFIKKRISLAAFLLSLPILFLVFKQPDLGNTLLYFTSLCFILVASGVTIKKALSLVLVAVFSFPLVWHFMADYQKARILTFLDPNLDPAGSGYNALQSVIAVGSGQLFGKGVGYGTQSHLNFLPEAHTDFIFASFAEEFGFLGSMIFLLFYFGLLVYILSLARKVADKEGKVIIYGIFGMLLVQVLINIGMNVGVLPITGVTLPFISYGGSSIISVMISFGIIQNIIRTSQKNEVLEIR